jgi:hypothetical protein
MKNKLLSVFLLPLLLASMSSVAQNVLEDDGIGMTLQELEQIVALWSPQMRAAAANDNGDRLEFLNKALTSKKLEAEAGKLSPEENPELYWKTKFLIRDALEGVVVDKFIAELVTPDMTELARERYLVDKDKYAFISEQRLSAHILIACSGGGCEREEKRALAESIYAKLEAGEDFKELAGEYSEDKASRDKGGLFDRWLKAGERGVDKDYVQSLFEIAQPGELSGVVSSAYGFHIIKLEDIKAPYYKTFEEVEPRIVKELESEFLTQSVRTYIRSFKLGKKAFIDGPAMEELFSKYKSAAPH